MNLKVTKAERGSDEHTLRVNSCINLIAKRMNRAPVLVVLHPMLNLSSRHNLLYFHVSLCFRPKQTEALPDHDHGRRSGDPLQRKGMRSHGILKGNTEECSCLTQGSKSHHADSHRRGSDNFHSSKCTKTQMAANQMT